MNQHFDDFLAFLEYYQEVWTKDKYIARRNLSLDMPSPESQSLVSSFMSWITPKFKERILIPSYKGSYDEFLKDLQTKASLEDQLFLVKRIIAIFGYNPEIMNDVLSPLKRPNGVFIRARILDEISNDGELSEYLWEQNPSYVPFIKSLYDKEILKLDWPGITSAVVLENILNKGSKDTIDYKHVRVKARYVKDYLLPLWREQGYLDDLSGFWKSIVKQTILKKDCDAEIIEDFLVAKDQGYEELICSLGVVPGTLYGVNKSKNGSLSNYFSRNLLPEETMEIFQHLVSWVEEDQEEVLEQLLFVNPLPRLLFNRALYLLHQKGHHKLWYEQARSHPELLVNDNLKRLMRVIREKRSTLKPESSQGIKMEKFHKKLRQQAKNQGLTLHSFWG